MMSSSLTVHALLPNAKFASLRSPPCASQKFVPRIVCGSSSSEASTSQATQITNAHFSTDRRQALLALGLLPSLISSGSANAGQVPQVGRYLPSAGVEDFVLFVPDREKTPAIRAGTVDRDHPYSFAIPPTWQEAKVANIRSGNYCQPKCAEPWTEVIFQSEKEGKLEVTVAPLVRLTNKPEATIDSIGPPAGILVSLGAFITGTYLDSDDVISMESKKVDGRTYYYYEVNAPYGTNGPHTLTAATTKGDLAFLFVVSANDRQWATSQGMLRKVVETFRA